jgi:mannose/fructose/N-acetylgalactosamine-specific phosphotransferase system component IIB
MTPAPRRWLLRIDDRLVHGQVCVGWCDALDITQLILCDDEIAASEFEQDLFRCCPVEEQDLRFLTVAELAEEMQSPPIETTLVVFAGPRPVLDLLAAGAEVTALTLGGLHHRPGAREILDYLFLTEGQEADLRALLGRGVAISCQPLPSSPRQDLGKLLG